MLDVPVLDAHVHLWDPRVTPRAATPAVRLFGWSPWLLARLTPALFPRAALAFVGSPQYVLAPFLPGDLRAEQDGAGQDATATSVKGFVHIEAAWKRRDPMRLVEETRWLESVCGRDLLAIVAHADLAHPDLDVLLDAHRAASRRVVGIRDKLAFSADKSVMSWCNTPARMRDPQWRRGFRRLGERGLSFDAWCYSDQLPDLIDVVRSEPGTRVVLDHLGTPVGGLDPKRQANVLPAWRDALSALAEHPQVSVKVSGLTMPVLGGGFHSSTSPVTSSELADRLAPLVSHALAQFGHERCLFASNFPMDLVSVRWRTLYGAYAQLTSGLTIGKRRAVFHDNASAFYGVAK